MHENIRPCIEMACRHELLLLKQRHNPCFNKFYRPLKSGFVLVVAGPVHYSLTLFAVLPQSSKAKHVLANGLTPCWGRIADKRVLAKFCLHFCPQFGWQENTPAATAPLSRQWRLRPTLHRFAPGLQRFFRGGNSSQEGFLY